MTDTDPWAETNPSTDAIRYGRRAPTFVPVPEWIVCAGLNAQALALYTVLLAHVNRVRGDGAAWPGQDALAELLGYTNRKTISRYLPELTAIGAVEVTTQTLKTGRRNVYTVNELPPDEYTGPRSLTAFYATRTEPVGGTSPPGDDGSSSLGDNGSSPTRDMNQRNRTRGTEPDEGTSGDASPAGGHRASALTATKVIYTPRGFDQWAEDCDAIQYLVAAAIKTMTTAGLAPHHDAADAIGRTLTGLAERGHSRADLAAYVEQWVNEAGTTRGAGWLASVLQSPPTSNGTDPDKCPF
ncbi:helix-turn-helix domain-containing protein [Pseudonocardia sp. C8]|uniref:helix-turn-helix domain-containing protein n=1 Tax=Pseudonocardia sp. C8 TaxID=2762759 RepID=UPI0016435A05|nr:helix-turn-helix domain-containing protein [Pseudonocardia sp. C8]MBC3191654.1 helix-turn-helix domain-containing protein [Pseudonocardia sp. C8]